MDLPTEPLMIRCLRGGSHRGPVPSWLGCLFTAANGNDAPSELQPQANLAGGEIKTTGAAQLKTNIQVRRPRRKT